MSYLHRTGGPPVAREVLIALADAAGLRIPEEDLEKLSTALRDQLASIDQLDALDLTDVAPAATFDPRWHE